MSSYSGYDGKVEDAVRAVVIHSPTDFSWLGRRSPQLLANIRRALTPATTRGYLLYSLQERLYTDFYRRGFAAPSSLDIDDYSVSGMTPFVEQLSAANSGSGFWVDGWVVQRLDGHEVVVDKGGVAIWAGLEDCRLTGEHDILPGVPLNVRAPRELRAISPGYYMALGDASLSDNSSARLARFYWHVEPIGAVSLMRAITSALNDARHPFRLKILNHPAYFTRCDTAVLYILKDDYDPIASILEHLYVHLMQNLKPFTPVFTKQLAPGLSFAEDPGGTQSFGMHRCFILADGLIHAYERGYTDLHARVRTVIESFEAEGIDIEKPFLNSGSHDSYGFRPSSDHNAQSRSVGDLSEPAVEAIISHLPEDYLRTAVSIARGLVRDAVWYGDICNWLGTDLEPNGRTGQYDRTFAALGPTLYTGTAGVAFFLGELWTLVPDDAFRRTALGAIRQALSRTDLIVPAMRTGLYSGWAGIALVAGRLGRLMHEDELIARASDIVTTLVQDPHINRESDLLVGKAGTIAASSVLSYYLEDPSLLVWAASMGDELLLAADKNQRGYSWRSRVNKGVHSLTGLSHGASGIAFALLELWQITGEASYLQAAQMAFEYERHWFQAEVGNWPDFRLEAGETHGLQTLGISNSRSKRKRSWPFATSWCNGAPGIAMSRLRAATLLNNEIYRAEAKAALLTTSEAVRASLASASGNYSLCHGLSGNAEILLYGRQVLGEQWANEFDAVNVVRTVADSGIELYGDADRPWPCGLSRGVTPNLMLGLAGIGYFYLRLYKPSVPSILLVRPEEWTGGPV